MNRHIIALLLLCCPASFTWAEDIQLQDHPPERYTVVKGDTLWGISGKFLKDPWRWPQVWNMNRQQIKNPDRIYPGDMIVLDLGTGKPELRLLRETVVLEPGIIAEPLEKQAIPTIPPSAIDPFLSQPLVVDEHGLAGAPKIVGAQEGHVVLGPGIKVYVDKITEGDGLNWQLYRPGRPLIDPKTREQLGIEAEYLGEARVTHYGEPATIEIRSSVKDIYAGDRLVKSAEILSNGFLPHAPEGAIRGRIISAYDAISELGPNSIVTINRGSRDGMEEGLVLAIHEFGVTLLPPQDAPQEPGKKPQGLKLPDERIGLLMIFRTFERVSYALVMQVERPAHVLDVVTTP
ncbi:LysM domain/BON superfamily protein [mine drainage metagenome]|uniref:LysM domain/BON superfamily protein n=1 Tax=mine drainage metagenome TaxID=410659 RepID=A0A1J5QYU6_9ZZZZ